MTMPDDPIVPEVFETVLQPDEIDAYLADLDACAQDVRVSLRQGRLALPTPDGAPLQTAVWRLRDGEATGLQIRYRHEGQAWCDTLTLVPEGMRMVRVALPLA